jgi:hypothetical protein
MTGFASNGGSFLASRIKFSVKSILSVMDVKSIPDHGQEKKPLIAQSRPLLRKGSTNYYFPRSQTYTRAVPAIKRYE